MEEKDDDRSMPSTLCERIFLQKSKTRVSRLPSLFTQIGHINEGQALAKADGYDSSRKLAGRCCNYRPISLLRRKWPRQALGRGSPLYMTGYAASHDDWLESE